MNLKKLAVLSLGAMMSISTFAKENIVFWHAMSGEGQKTLEKIVNDYNNSQDKVIFEEVKKILQEARNKIYKTANNAMVEAYWNIGRIKVRENI